MAIMLPITARGPSNGLRAKAGRMVATMPMEGRIAMYTSGWPKNQKRCCQSSGEPPEWGWSLSLKTKFAGMKKLVPAVRSRISRMQAGSKTAKASSAITEVTNQAQEQNGMRASDMPLVRRSSVVEIKFNAPSSEAIQNTAIEMAQRFWPMAKPGPASPPTALSGAYAVQPEIGGPSATKNAAIMNSQATKVVQKDIMLKRGKAMSSAPIWMGRK